MPWFIEWKLKFILNNIKNENSYLLWYFDYGSIKFHKHKNIKFKSIFNIKKKITLIMIKYNISTSLNYFVTIWSNDVYFENYF